MPAAERALDGPETRTGALPAAVAEEDVRERTTWFGRLEIGWDERILQPRPWTTAQSRWAAALLPDLPPGPVLELCSGAGHIGLLTVAGSPRDLVCVDVDPVATAYAAANAARNGLADRVTARTETVADAASHGPRYALVVADPPWVPSADTGRFPEDPLRAIDGGLDGTDLALACVATAAAVLQPDGALVLQVGTVEQVDGPVAAGAAGVGLRVVERRAHQRGALALLRPVR